MENNINFKGLLYGSNLRHVSKPVLCCHHGDAKFVRMLNNSAKKAPKFFFENNGVFFYRKEGVTCIKIKTKEIPGFNFLEKLFFDISPIQQKLINKRKENLFTDLIFHLNKFEFEFLKDKYLYITGKELKDFETIVKQNIDPAQQELADDFFNS